MLRTLLAVALAAATGIESQGTVVIAKTQGDATILWDITPAVAPMVAAPGTADAKIAELEIGAARILLSRLDELPAATRVTVRVLYKETGEVSPAYKTATFIGVEKVLDVSSPRATAEREKSAWEAELAKGVLPAEMDLKVTGVLPHS